MIRNAPTLIVLGLLGLSALAQPAAAQVVHEGYSHDPGKIVTSTPADRADLKASPAALANHTAERPSIRVKIGDLNLASQKDVNRLFDRVTEAAGEVCGRGPLANFIAGPPPEFLACRDDVVEASLSRLDAPLVVALREKTRTRRELAAR